MYTTDGRVQLIHNFVRISKVVCFHNARAEKYGLPNFLFQVDHATSFLKEYSLPKCSGVIMVQIMVTKDGNAVGTNVLTLLDCHGNLTTLFDAGNVNGNHLLYETRNIQIYHHRSTGMFDYSIIRVAADCQTFEGHIICMIVSGTRVEYGECLPIKQFGTTQGGSSTHVGRISTTQGGLTHVGRTVLSITEGYCECLSIKFNAWFAIKLHRESSWLVWISKHIANTCIPVSGFIR